MTIKTILQYLESIAPPAYQESYDNAGLIVGNAGWECTGALLCLDSLEVTIDEAIEKNCNLIIAHHPIVFRGLKKINGKNYVERIIVKAIKSDVAIYAAHTNLDNVHVGVNKRICDTLGLTDTQILAPKSELYKKLFTFCPTKAVESVRAALFAGGAGHIGNYDECSFNTEGYGTFRGNENSTPFVGEEGKQHKEMETKIEVVFPAFKERQIVQSLLDAHPYEEVAYDIVSLDNSSNLIGSGMFGKLSEPMDEKAFLMHLKEKMQADCVRYTQLLGKPVETVAVCGGAGSFLLSKAMGVKADVFVTADYKYHEFFDADGRILIADIGHYESEQFTIDLFKDVLSKKFPNFAFFLTENNTNPVNYL